LTDRLTEESLRVLDGLADRPFFLNLCYHTVHTPIEGKVELVERFAGKIKPGLNHRNATYAAMVSSLDESVGRILSHLEDHALADNTVVVFTSDNGGFVNRWEGRKVTNNSPLRSGKGSLYEGGIRVPLIVRWPEITNPGSVCSEPVVSCDLYSTILEVAQLEGDSGHNADLDGLSLVPLLRDPSARLSRDTLFFHYPHYYPTTSPVSAVRTGDWKFLHYYEDDHGELYNLAHDPGESEDMASRYPDRARRLRQQLDSWREALDAARPQSR
jgi:arylsulfatase A-like enzyme